jgi:hypothetical protein
MKKRRFEDGGDVDYDKDSDAEAQKVYRSDLSEASDSERMPKRSAPAKKAAPKRGTKGHKDYFNAADPDMSVKGVRNEDTPSKKPTFGETMRKRVKDVVGMKTGGSVGSASKRADGCAQRGKTKGRMI